MFKKVIKDAVNGSYLPTISEDPSTGPPEFMVNLVNMVQDGNEGRTDQLAETDDPEIKRITGSTIEDKGEFKKMVGLERANPDNEIDDVSAELFREGIVPIEQFHPFQNPALKFLNDPEPQTTIWSDQNLTMTSNQNAVYHGRQNNLTQTPRALSQIGRQMDAVRDQEAVVNEGPAPNQPDMRQGRDRQNLPREEEEIDHEQNRKVVQDYTQRPRAMHLGYVSDGSVRSFI